MSSAVHMFAVTPAPAPVPAGGASTSPILGPLEPRPPPHARPTSAPAKMAQPTIQLLNTFAASVQWTPPADLHSRRARVVLAAHRGLNRAGAATPEGSLPVVGYRLRYLCRAPDLEEAVEHQVCEQTWSKDEDHAVLKWLVGGQEYTFEVCAFNSAGDGPWSEPSEPFVMPSDSFFGGAREPPTFLSTSADTIEIKWRSPCHRGAPIGAYDILCSEDPDFGEEHTRHLQIPGDATTLKVSDLRPNTVYYFKYRAANAKGTSPWSAATPGAGTAAMPPSRPAAPIRLDTDPRPFEVSIRWEPPESFNIPIRHYRVRRACHPNMSDAVDITLGGGPGAGVGVPLTKEGHLATEEASGGTVSAVPSPSGRRPGFGKGGYAITQLKAKGLQPATNYYFQVKAVSLIGESDWSEPSRPMRTAPPLPPRCEKPRFISGSRVHGMRIYWPVPEEASSDLVITRYDIRVAHHAMMLGALEAHSVMTEAYQVEGRGGGQLLTTVMEKCWDPGVVHFYQVRCATNVGLGDWSETSEGMYVAAEPPLAPEAPHHFVILPRCIIAHWKAPDCRGSPITGYRLQYAENSNMVDARAIRGIGARKLEYPVPSLRPHVSYFFQVLAENEVGASPWSPPSRPVAVLQVPPTKMGSPTLVARTSSTIMVGFSPPCDSGTRDGELIQSYTVVYAQGPERLRLLARAIGPPEDADTPWASGVVRLADPKGTTAKGLRPGVLCAFQVFAVNEFGEGELSEVAEFATDASNPDPPKAPEVGEPTRWSVVLSFELGNDNGAPIRHYDIQTEDVAAGTRTEAGTRKLELDAHGLQFFGVNHLRPGLAYRFRARVSNSVGDSEWSEASAVARTEAAPPDPVDEREILDVGPTTFKIAWQVPGDNGDPITEYCVQWTADEDFHVVFKELKTSDPSLTAVCDGVSAGSRYFARVAACNAMGYGVFGRGVPVDMLANVPDAPARPRVVDVCAMQATLSWMLPYDCGSRVTNFWLRFYETAKDGRPEHKRHRGEMLIVGRRHTCLSDLLLCEREYCWEIAAENELGVGPYSVPSVPARTLGPSVPTCSLAAPTLVAATMSSLTIRWTASEPMGSDITEQVLQICLKPTFDDDAPVREIAYPPWDLSVAPKGEDGSPCAGGGRGGAEPPGAALLSPTSPSAVQAAAAGAVKLDELSAILSDPDKDPEAKRAALEEKRAIIRKASSSKIGAFVSTFLLAPKEGDYVVDALSPGTGYFARVASRNQVGLSEWSPVSELLPTDIGLPAPIPEHPGIACVRSGCTTLTFAWHRPETCNGAPITHYVVRIAESEVELRREDCREFEQDELSREAWDGMVHPAEPAAAVTRLEALHDEETICKFVDYVLVRFGALQAAWEWLDVSGDGAISQEEFIEGDVDNGAPFKDFKEKEVLPRVWQLLDSDGGGSISMREFDRLKPYMDKVRSSSAGLDVDGVWCFCPGLTPGKSYYLMACSANKVGRSQWTQCLVDPCKTLAMSPSKTPPLRGVPELRTCESVTFRWDLPYDNGAVLNDVEVRYCARDVEDGRPSRQHLREGKLVELEPDPATGVLPTELKLDGFLPGQIVFAVARCFNHIGGAREWSDLPGPGSGSEDDLITWDCATRPIRPDPTEPPTVAAADLFAENFTSWGSFTVAFRQRTNGLPFSSFDFEILDKKGEICQSWTDASSREETAEILKAGELRKPVKDLAPGESYTIRARVSNAVGPAAWSGPSDVFTMPPDIPHQPQPPLLENTSLRWIELKWFAPYANGAPITQYDLAYSMKDEWPIEDWSRVPEIEMLHGVKEHGHDGRRTLLRDRGSLVFRLEKLNEFTMYFFKLRCRNVKGWSEWSDVATFKTKTVEPSKMDSSLMRVTSITKTSLQFRWTAPECNGEEIIRFDVVGGSNARLLKWAVFVQLMLRTCPDPDRLFGFAPPGGLEIGDVVGQEGLDKLVYDECVFAPISALEAHFEISGLMPGQDYFFSMRALNKIGKGELSSIFGPITTRPDSPADVAAMELLDAAETSARVAFPLPWDSGVSITGAKFRLLRKEGPLSHLELHPETQEPHPHLEARDWPLSIKDCPLLDPAEVQEKGEWVPGTTNAILRAFQEEGAPAGRCQTRGHVLSTSAPTGFRHVVSVADLLPGTRYEIAWGCRNSIGWSSMSGFVSFQTDSMVPDTPEDLIIGTL